MADLGLVKQLMDAGLDRTAATAQVEAVTSAIVAQLRSDKAVTLPGVGVLRAPETTHAAPHPRSKLRKERRATLRRGPHLVEAGEPYDNLDYVPPKRSTYGSGGYR